jgi:DNA-binding transcriptional LysR family regulator
MDFLARVATFVRVVEGGSLSRAARTAGLSVAAVSRQVSTLEEELGAALLVRTTRTLRLTDEGRRFYEHATRLVRGAEMARASVRRDGAVHGDVVLSASVTLGILRIVPSLSKLLAARPALRVHLRLEDRAVDLVSEGIDIAVRAGLSLPDTTGLVALRLATFARSLVAAPSYLRRFGTPRTVAALANHSTIVGIESGNVWRFGNDAVSIEPRLRIGTLLGIREAVVAGNGIAILPDFVTRALVADGALRVLLPDADLPPVVAHALYRVEQRGVPRVDALLAHLRATLPLDGDKQ